jgi:FMN-dependent NADH-azoreductase
MRSHVASAPYRLELGLPLYNFGPPSSVKAWVDHVVAGGLSVDFERGKGLLGGRELIVLAARGGGYAPGVSSGWMGPRAALAAPTVSPSPASSPASSSPS